MDAFLRFLTVLLIFVFVLVITQLTTRYVANYQKNRLGGGTIRLLESARLNNNAYIQLVNIAGRVLVLAVAKDNISVICELTEEEYNSFSSSDDFACASKAGTFKDILSKAKENLQHK